ncbi:MAG: HAD family phosphatase [Prevotellaceae bacterium]|jgi:putative hydrolase of the HAD superfamily|nr:HAD family phosphatase [Prevotellaceae bacterium]
MIKKEIKNLLIDFGGVLIDLDRPRCIANFQQLGVSEVASLLDEYHQQGFFLQYEKGLIDDAAFRAEIRSRIGRPVTDARIDAAWNSFLGTIAPAKLELLLRLRSHYTLYLLSNTNRLHWEWSLREAFRYHGQQVTDCFKRLYLSFELHLAKPDAAIFRYVLEDAALLPQETLFIDDSAENCKTAASLGLSTYQPQAGEDWSHLFA